MGVALLIGRAPKAKNPVILVNGQGSVELTGHRLSRGWRECREERCGEGKSGYEGESMLVHGYPSCWVSC